MTREEVISGLEFTAEMFLFDPSTGEIYAEPQNDMDKTTIDACRGAIELLKQEPKTGHWIMTGDYYTGAYGTIDYVECSCCHEDSLEEGNYCPNCGAKMVEPQESEG